MAYINKEGLLLSIQQAIYDGTGIMDVIVSYPPSNVQEVRHGNWVGIDDEPYETFECDRCGFVLEDWIQGALYNYCPNCGARMNNE